MKIKSSIILLFVSVLFLIAQNLSAQEQLGMREKADRLFDQFQYSKAAAIYLKINDTKTPKLHDLERLAECYRKMNQYQDAEIWYARVVANKESRPENLIYYGELLKANVLYPKAKKVLKDYAKQTGKIDDVAVAIAGCDSALIWMSNPTKHKIRNESGVNTENSEFSVFPMGDKVYYAGEPLNIASDKKYGWTGKSFLRIYTANRSEKNTLTDPSLLGSDVNSESYHIGPITGNKTADTFFITRTYPGKNGVVKKDDRGTYTTNNMELYIQSTEDGKWQKPVPFVYNNVKQYSVGHAALSPDGKVLYFVSDMPGGEGGTDIWFCTFQADGTWGILQNAGSTINTEQDELFPTMGSDGTLYYSTSGLPGMGGLDIFRVKGSKDVWKTPVNMGYPINSAGDDFSFVYNDKQTSGYFSSNRKKGRGMDDIFSFTIQKPKVDHYLKATVLNKQTKVIIPNASVTLSAGEDIIAKQNSRADGTVLFQVDESMVYNVLGVKESYYADSANVAVKESDISDTLRVALYLDQLFEKGKTIRIENIHYNFDKDDIRADAAIILDKLVQTMHENPTLKIELASHTDSRGTVEYNHNLSQRRAQSAVNYLVSRGIERTRMIAHGYGESKLLNKCSDGIDCTDEEHQANRRTEFTILEY
ncbi:MAG: OmpA family protein [Bacteroidales bacterium]|nr:OmpA family protein [Bacteroidales bacterium]